MNGVFVMFVAVHGLHHLSIQLCLKETHSLHVLPISEISYSIEPSSVVWKQLFPSVPQTLFFLSQFNFLLSSSLVSLLLLFPVCLAEVAGFYWHCHRRPQSCSWTPPPPPSPSSHFLFLSPFSSFDKALAGINPQGKHCLLGELWRMKTGNLKNQSDL